VVATLQVAASAHADDVSLADVGAKLLLEQAHDAEGFNQLFGFVENGSSFGIKGRVCSSVVSQATRSGSDSSW